MICKLRLLSEQGKVFTNMGKKKRGTRGAGSITRRKDGRWVGRYTVELPNGQHEVRAIYGKTQGEVREELVQCIARRDRGEIMSSNSMTVERFYTIWMDEIVDNRLKPTTIELYRRLFEKYILPVLGKKKLISLDVGDVERCFNLTKRRSLHQACAVKKALSSMLSSAKDRRCILVNPARDLRVRKVKPKETVIWNKDQLKIFLNEAKNSSSYYVAYAIMANYGLRRGEVLGLRWEDVDFSSGCIHIRRQIVSCNNRPQIGELKTDSSIRDLPLNEWLVSILRSRFEPGMKGLIFQTRSGNPIAPRNFYRDFQKVAKRAGLPHIKIHALRHMAACFMRDEGVDPKTCQSILGHATLDMTLRIYQHGSTECERAASAKLGKLLLG